MAAPLPRQAPRCESEFEGVRSPFVVGQRGSSSGRVGSGGHHSC